MKKIGNVCYVNLIFDANSDGFVPGNILASLSNIQADGRQYLFGYITNGTDFTIRLFYIENNDNRIIITDQNLTSNYLLVVRGVIVCK